MSQEGTMTLACRIVDALPAVKVWKRVANGARHNKVKSQLSCRVSGVGTR